MNGASKLALATGIVAIMVVESMSLHTAAPEGEDAGWHTGSLAGGTIVQSFWVMVHRPGVICGTQLALTVHASRVWILHVPGCVGHCALLVQPSPVTEQVWPKLGQVAAFRQAKPELLQVPESVGQLALTVHTKPELEHVPGMIGHWALFAQTVGTIEHWPERPHCAFTVQACPLRLHPPAIVGHCALLVHTALLTLQRPLASGHAALLKQFSPVTVHCPGWVGHRSGGQTALVIEQ